MRWLLNIIINAVLFMALAGFFKESIYIESIYAALGASVVLSILNILVKPILIILTLPVTVLTLGLFLLVINAITLYLTDKIMGSAFELNSFGTAFFTALIMSLVNTVIQKQLEARENKS